MPKTKIGTAEAIMMILTTVVVHSMLSLPKTILTSQKSASLLNVIYISTIAIILSYLVFKLFKKFPGLDIIDIAELLGGKLFKNIIGTVFILFFIISSSILLRNFCESLKIVYYPMTDIIFIIGLFIVSVCIANSLDFNASLKTNLIVLPIVLFSIIFLFLANMRNFSPEKIFPVLGDGIYNTFFTGLINLSAFGGFSFLYFIPPLLKEPKHLKKISFISIGLTAIYLFLTVATLLFMFSFFLDINEIMPLYNAARYIQIGSFFQRLESLFLLIWILAFACYLSIATKFAMSIFKKLTNITTKKPLNNICGLLIFAIALLPPNYAISQKFESKIYPYLVVGIVFVLGIGILILANLFKRRRKNNLEGV